MIKEMIQPLVQEFTFFVFGFGPCMMIIIICVVVGPCMHVVVVPI
jgi:hypothetical protein